MDRNACGSPLIDGLVARGRMGDVWTRLEHRYQEVRRVGQSALFARQDGRISFLIRHDPKYATLNKPFGPETDAEWDLLRDCVLEAVNVTMHELRTRYLAR